MLNATHRDSHAEPTPLVPGQVYELTIDLDATSWLFEPGHRPRLSLSHADFPNTWPMPSLATGRLHTGPARPSRLRVPVLDPVTDPLPTPVFEPVPLDDPAGSPPPPPVWRVTRDQMSGRVEVAIEGGGTTRIDGDYVQETQTTAVASVDEREPARASVLGRQTVRYRWPGQTIELQSRGHLVSDATTLHLSLHVAITVDGLPHFDRHWLRSYPRHLL